MKVFRRILIKLIILVLVIVLFGAAAYLVYYYPQSNPESALEAYLTLLVENNIEKAYEQLDQSENTQMTQEEYETAILAGKFALYDTFQIEEILSRQGANGDSYVDYHVEFLDTSGEVQMETDISVKRQSKEIFGLMAQWKVLASHCMVTNLKVTVPTGSTLYLDGEEAGTSWLVTEDVSTSKDCYQIPSLLLGTVQVVIRNPIFDSLELSLKTSDGDVDYSDQMTLKESARSACMELAVAALKQIYIAAATEDVSVLEDLFSECLEEAAEIATNQTAEFYQEDTVTHADFESVGIYDYEADFDDPVFTEDENGAITVAMTFNYHYNVQNQERVETGEIWADGTNAWEVRTVSHSGEAEAEFTMSYYDDEWHIVSVDIPVIPEEESAE